MTIWPIYTYNWNYVKNKNAHQQISNAIVQEGRIKFTSGIHFEVQLLESCLKQEVQQEDLEIVLQE